MSINDFPIQEDNAATIARLTAENARYREALTEIAEHAEGRKWGSEAIARRALADADTGEGRGE